MRKVLALIEVDDELADREKKGTIDYLTQEFGWLLQSNIFLKTATIVDADDEFDKEKVEFIRKFL